MPRYHYAKVQKRKVARRYRYKVLERLGISRSKLGRKQGGMRKFLFGPTLTRHGPDMGQTFCVHWEIIDTGFALLEAMLR